MANAAILFQNLSYAAAVNGTAPVYGLGYDRLKDRQPRHRARINAASGYFILTLGSEYPVDCAALISTNLTASATARLRMSKTDAAVTTALTYDSGTLSGATSAASNGNVVLALSGSADAQFLRWDIADATLATLDIGLAPCGALFRPQRNYSFGAQRGREDFSVRQGNALTGAQFIRPGPTARSAKIEFKALTGAEADALDEADRLYAGEDALFIPDTSLTPSQLSSRAIWGAWRGDTAVRSEHRAFDLFARSFSVIERL